MQCIYGFNPKHSHPEYLREMYFYNIYYNYLQKYFGNKRKSNAEKTCFDFDFFGTNYLQQTKVQ